MPSFVDCTLVSHLDAHCDQLLEEAGELTEMADRYRRRGDLDLAHHIAQAALRRMAEVLQLEDGRTDIAAELEEAIIVDDESPAVTDEDGARMSIERTAHGSLITAAAAATGDVVLVQLTPADARRLGWTLIGENQ